MKKPLLDSSLTPLFLGTSGEGDNYRSLKTEQYHSGVVVPLLFIKINRNSILSRLVE